MAPKRERLDRILAQLRSDGGSIRWLDEREARAVNAATIAHCCFKERLVAAFVDALRPPFREVALSDDIAAALAHAIPRIHANSDVYLATDLFGWFELSARSVHASLTRRLWTHEVYVVGAEFDWLVGYRNGTLSVQGLATGDVTGRS